MIKPTIYAGTSKICELTVKNEYGHTETVRAQFNEIDNHWKTVPRGQVVDLETIESWKEIPASSNQ